MAKGFSWGQVLRDRVVGPVLVWRAGGRLSIWRQGALRLEMVSPLGMLAADRRHRMLSRNGRLLARFEQVRSVDIVHLPGNEHEPHRWELRLQLHGSDGALALGSAPSATQASRIAERLSDHLQCELMAWTEWL